MRKKEEGSINLSNLEATVKVLAKMGMFEFKFLQYQNREKISKVVDKKILLVTITNKEHVALC